MKIVKTPKCQNCLNAKFSNSQKEEKNYFSPSGQNTKKKITVKTH